MIEYRLLDPPDVPGVLPLVLEFEAAIANPVIQIDPAAFVQNWTRFLEIDVGFVILASDDGRPVGGLSAYLVPNDLNGSAVAQETWWFVKPEYRGRGVGDALLELFERYARSRGALRVSMGVILHLTPVADLLTTRGYTPFETIFYKWLG